MKTDDEVRSYVESLIELARSNQEVESDKVDFKRTWYDLNSESGIMEFIKDSSAIANTPGGDGYLVIGVDTKGKVYDVSFQNDSGLADESHIQNLMIKHTDTPFNIRLVEAFYETKKYSIIHIPPSNHKPHLIKKFVKFRKDKETSVLIGAPPIPNAIFIRRGSSNRFASKAELDDIYRYRHEHVVDIDLIATANPQTFTYYNKKEGDRNNRNHLYCTLIIENVGFRPVSIEQIILNIDIKTNDFKFHEVFKSYSVGTNHNLHSKELIKYPIVIRSGDIVVSSIGFRALNFKSSEEFGKIIRGTMYTGSLSVSISSLSQPLNITLNKP